MHSPARRLLLRSAGALALAPVWPRISQAALDFPAVNIPIADSHSHLGLHDTGGYKGALKAEMQAAGVMLLAWTIVGDGRWIVRTNRGIMQRSIPGRGDQSRYVRQKLAEMKKYLAANDLAHVDKPSDIDAARSGKPQVVIAMEGAGFAEDGLELIEQFHGAGLRHLQLVHYVRNGMGDFQTERPEHNGMTPLGVDVIKACNRLGILVDLAHATNAVIDRALEVSSTPVIWSHSEITRTQYTWQQPQSRLLHIDYAKKIAQRGGAVGLWSLRSSRMTGLPGYADGFMRMIHAVGPEHVMFGTDLDGVGQNGLMNGLGDLRAVVDLLRKRGVDDRTLRAVCFENYARCLRATMEARRV